MQDPKLNDSDSEDNEETRKPENKELKPKEKKVPRTDGVSFIIMNYIISSLQHSFIIYMLIHLFVCSFVFFAQSFVYFSIHNMFDHS